MVKKERKRRYNTRRIKQSHSYTLQEIAALFGIHKNTVRGWCRRGLHTIDRVKPLLVHGGVLISYIKQQQASRKATLKREEFYCFKCRAPRLPMGSMVDCIPHGEKRLLLTALCSVCEGILHKMGSVCRLPEYESLFCHAQPSPPNP
jgi:hypothetical protein